MRYEELMRGLPYRLLQPGESRPIESLSYDSRTLQPGGCFFCEKGLHHDGADYLPEVRRKGASAILLDRELSAYGENLTVLWVENLRWAMPRIAANFYPDCLKEKTVVGITGTNGKTTTSTLMHHIGQRAGQRCGLIGTNGYRIGQRAEPTVQTTPMALDLYALFDRMQQEAVTTIVMEVSSHALDQHRVDTVPFRLGIFTNLTQDHLDYHITMEAYRQAKAKLFHQSEEGLYNGDDPAADDLRKGVRRPAYRYGLSSSYDYYAANLEQTSVGIAYDWYGGGKKLGRIRYPMPGQFTVYNTLAAASGCHRLGIEADVIEEALTCEPPAIDGRFQCFRGADGLTVIVDYAHTPDGLSKVLETIRSFAEGRVVTVFGCGGDRDAAKRPPMGRIAGTYSDRCWLTTDNPRWEDPEHILEEVEEGLVDTGCPYQKEPDRIRAIRQAIETAAPQDVILVAGKGHETGQWIRGERRPMDDRAEVQKALRERDRNERIQGEKEYGTVTLTGNRTGCERTDPRESGDDHHECGTR